MMKRFPISEEQKINFGVPNFTLDVNQLTTKKPAQLGTEVMEMPIFEFNYFYEKKIELCVTPETAFEITKGVLLDQLGSTAYRRIKKSDFFKKRPYGSTLDLTDNDANYLWQKERQLLWPTVSDYQLNQNQRSDVNQLFYHTVTSGTSRNSAFLTIDKDFIGNAKEIYNQFGVQVFTPHQAYDRYANYMTLPTEYDKNKLWQDQQKIIETLRQTANSGIVHEVYKNEF